MSKREVTWGTSTGLVFLRSLYCIFSVAIPGVLNAQDGIATKQEEPSVHVAAERMIVEQVCKGQIEAYVLRLANVGYDSNEGIACAAKIIEMLSVEKLKGNPGLLSASDTIWRLVDRAILRKDRRIAIRGVLEKIRTSLDHPLRSEAWLGLRMLDREDGTVQRVGSFLPYMPIPFTHQSGLSLIGSPELLKERFERSHPVQREALLWAMSEINRGIVENTNSLPNQSPTFKRLSKLAEVLVNYAVIRKDFLETFVDGLFKEGYLLLSPIISIAAPSGSNSLPAVHFVLKGKICTDGSNCQDVNTDTLSATNLRFIQTTPLNDTLSQAQIYVPFFDSPTSPDKIASYVGHIESYIAGGRWTERSMIGNILLKAGDGTSTVNYTLEGTIKIPACMDPLACSIQVEVASYMTPSNSGTKTIASLQLDGPTGKDNLPTGSTWSSRLIDRSVGEHTLSFTMSRSDSHQGSCCANWQGQGFGIHIFKPNQGLNGSQIVNTKIATPALPSWVNPKLFESLKAFVNLPSMLNGRMPTDQASTPLAFGNLLAPSAIDHDVRFADLWARTAFARLALSWGAEELQPTEINELTALRSSLSFHARSQLIGPLAAELEAWSFTHEALDPTPILPVIAALVRDTNLTAPLDDAEAKIVAAQGKITDGDSGKALAKANEALEAVRAGQPKVDAILTLMGIEDELLRKGRETRTYYERLAREIAQLKNGSE